MIKMNCPFLDEDTLLDKLESAEDVASVNNLFQEQRISSGYFIHHCLMGDPLHALMAHPAMILCPDLDMAPPDRLELPYESREWMKNYIPLCFEYDH